MKVSLVYPKLGGQLSRAMGLLMGSFHPPLGIMYLASVLKENDIEVNLIDLSFSGSWDEYRNELKNVNPDVVGISSLSPFAGQATLAASIAKESLPKCKVVMGGAHPTAMPNDTIKLNSVDFVVVGESERSFPELIEAIKGNVRFSDVKGIFYKENGNIQQTPNRDFIKNLDEIPFPDRELLPTWEKYLSQIPFFPYIQPHTTIMAGRGCPFNCSFCQPMLNKMFGRGIRLRSPENVIKEIEYLVLQYKIKSFFFFDDTFTVFPDWTAKMCNEIIQRKIDLVWGINSRVNTFSRDIAEKLKKAGCIYISFGVESGSQVILDEVLDKGISLQQIINAFEICRDVGIISMASLMIGNPKETRESIRKTISLVKMIKPDIIDVHFTTPTPGSNMYEFYKDSLITSQKNRYQVGGLKLPKLSTLELEDLYDQIQIQWRMNKDNRKHYKIAKKRYIIKNIHQGIKRPLRYIIFALYLLAESSVFCYRLLNLLKNIYLKLYSFIIRSENGI